MKLTKDEFINKLGYADSIVFFTGAGISAESGISTFRGTDGIWNKLKPEELANFDAFLKNPDRVWEWYQYRRKIINESAPNPAHIAIAEMQNYYEHLVVVTQNVDNLHNRAGSKTVYELHGNIERNYCIKCNKFYDSPDFASDKVPVCECGGLIRPDIVWFGEYLPQDVFDSAEAAARDCDIMFVVGTSSVVFPAAQIPIIAKQSGAVLIEINLEDTELSYMADFVIHGKAGLALPEIMENIKKIRKKIN